MPDSMIAPRIEREEFQVNTTTSGNEFNPSITYLNDGSFVVVWAAGDIRGQFYDPTGNPVGTEFRVNDGPRPVSTDDPTIMSLEDGGFVVAWSAPPAQDTLDFDVFAQRYDATGSPVGANFVVSETTSDRQQNPSIAGLSDGGFVISWDSLGQDGEIWGVFAQKFDPSGARVGGEFQVNSTTNGSQLGSTTLELAGAGFVVVWQSDADGQTDIFARIYDTNGDPIDGEFLINTITGGNQLSPTAAALSNGGFVVAWQTGLDGDGLGVFAQRFDNDGNALGEEFQVNTYVPGDQADPAITSLSDGGFVIAWESHADQDGSSLGVFAQAFNALGEPVGDEFQVNVYTNDPQYNPAIAASANNEFAIAWNSRGQDGTFDGVFARTFNIESNASPIAVADFATVDEDSTTSGNLLTNDSDADGDPLEVTTVNGLPVGTAIQGAYGTLIVTADGSYTYTADAAAADRLADGTSASESFTYEASDGEDSSTATLTITVSAVDDGRFVVGTDQKNVLSGGKLNDVIEGLGENDRLLGRDGNDLLDGGEGNDRLYGGNGNDFLFGGAGDDLLVGGEGSDTFVVGGEPGSVDTIHDFEIGTDTLLFEDGAIIDEILEMGRDAGISLSDGSSVVLKGISATELKELFSVSGSVSISSDAATTSSAAAASRDLFSGIEQTAAMDSLIELYAFNIWA